MRLALLLFVLTFSTTLLASECSEVSTSDSVEEVIELQGLANCSLRTSIYLYALSKNQSKEIYKNIYKCDGSNVNVNLERFRNKETTKLLVKEVEVKDPESLQDLKLKKNVTSLKALISTIEMKNNVNCTEQTRYFSKEQYRYYSCGGTKLKVEVTPYIKCTDSWKSL